jgi:hypothetical protein
MEHGPNTPWGEELPEPEETRQDGLDTLDIGARVSEATDGRLIQPGVLEEDEDAYYPGSFYLEA